MPVRIYDISKKLGLENKEVLSKAKELGITAARVASSSLDKITAEYLEEQLKLAHPELKASPPPVAASTPMPEQPIVVAPAVEARTTSSGITIETPAVGIQEQATVTASSVVVEAEPPKVELPTTHAKVEINGPAVEVEEPLEQ